MKKTAHKQNRFLNCLRIQVVPGYHEQQRIQNIVDFCKRYAFDNVMLFINAEEYNVGHMTKEEAKPWVDTMKRAKEALVKAGITVSLNPWMELGHVDRGRELKEDQQFVTMVDYNGTQSKISACPMDENWLTYFIDFYEYLIREIEPEVVWIEDDFRLHNHRPLEYGGCFCEHHMKAYNQRLETNYTRDEFVDLLFRKNPQEDVKRAFMEINRECMVKLATQIGDKVRSIGLGTKIGLMSSSHRAHSMEYRDWNGIHEGFATDGVKINRLHLPLYEEWCSMKQYYQDFNQIPFICRGFLPEDCHVLPELENASFMTFAKDAEVLRFQSESAIPLEIEGMTYDIFDFVGNGTIEAFGYGPAVAEIEDYMTAVMESGYSYYKLSGITIPLDEKNAYNRKIKNKFMDLRPDEHYLGAILQAHGISARCSKSKVFKDEIVVLAAGNVNNFTNEQLNNLFADNHVILEGMAVKKMLNRGLGSLIGVSGCQSYISEEDVHSYEQIEGDILVNGIPGYRASAFSRTGNYIAFTYTENPDVKSRVYDYRGNEIGLGMTISKGHLVIPYEVDDFYSNQLHPLRETVVRNYVESLKKDYAMSDYSSIYTYYSKGEENVLILVNSTLHTQSVTRFKMTGSIVRQIYEIDRDGIRREKDFAYDDEGFIVISEPFSALITKTFILKNS